MSGYLKPFLLEASMHKIAMLGAGLIGRFYTMSLQGYRGKDEVTVVCASHPEEADKFANEFGIPRSTAEMAEAIRDPEVDTVIVALPNFLHKKAVLLAAEAGKAVLCTKPLAINGHEALEMLEAVEKAGVFHGYLEDLVYTPKTLKALASTRKGALGKVLWARSRETHGGPHSDWFWNKQLSGGGAIVDMGCHCIEIARNFIGKDNRPLEVTCWADTQVHPIDAEDHAVGLAGWIYAMKSPARKALFGSTIGCAQVSRCSLASGRVVMWPKKLRAIQAGYSLSVTKLVRWVTLKCSWICSIRWMPGRSPWKISMMAISSIPS
jgi:predicted dehydrogenase